ncbi:YqjF family protein [Streptomonospora wellingtoniae]|uniref:DUF2071 domain-containing protein n=1 Tax=Streptomonospora wellingtoniae TaxID=3075544 RepID=A0ABU2L0C4_9ACTN|nr:DUF2071 domain-containing protein [Streptomonospora sp. DSM 45055]MDT0305004.1 DUF2071 domain-containing protein [Streptomonospora sp. DSM 45055]
MQQGPREQPDDAPPSARARARAGPAPLTQHWRDVVFVHWAADIRAVRRLLPAGTRPDTIAGRTYVGLVAFRVTAPRALGTLPTGGFDEVNVRLYSVDPQGRRGVVFLTMDADALPSVLAARGLTGVPYMWSDVSLRYGPAGSAGAVRRRWPCPAASARWHVAVGGPIPEPSRLEVFLTARWGLHTARRGRTVWLPVSHPPWSLHRAELRSYRGDLLPAAGITHPPAPPASVLWSPGTTAAFHLPQRVRP